MNSNIPTKTVQKIPENIVLSSIGFHKQAKLAPLKRNSHNWDERREIK